MTKTCFCDRNLVFATNTYVSDRNFFCVRMDHTIIFLSKLQSLFTFKLDFKDFCCCWEIEFFIIIKIITLWGPGFREGVGFAWLNLDWWWLHFGVICDLKSKQCGVWSVPSDLCRVKFAVPSVQCAECPYPLSRFSPASLHWSSSVPWLPSPSS